MNKNCIKLVLGMALAVSIAVAAGYWFHQQRYSIDRFAFPVPPDTRAADQYFLTEFKPRYRREQCIVRFDHVFRGPKAINDSVVLFSALIQFLHEYEPRAAMFDLKESSSGKRKSTYVQFADQCDLRFEIVDAFVDHMSWRFPEFEIIVDSDPVVPGPDTIDVSNNKIWLED